MSNTLKSIPLCQLQRSMTNVRKTNLNADIEQLAASIAAVGLLENLIVVPSARCVRERKVYEVIAGGRRLAALKLLARRKKIATDFPVPCQIRSDAAGATEASLAENFVRAHLHPADEFEAFHAMIVNGASADDDAARFRVSPVFVQQRLKLAAVSPRLVEEYRKGAMTLEQLTAFTVAADHKVQEAVWFDGAYADMPAIVIRRLLTKASVAGSDRRARCVGTKAYEAAGGIVVRDLFDTEDEGYFSDSQLLDRLVAEKLEAEATSVRAEGWQWVRVYPDPDSLQLHRFGRAHTIERDLSKAEEKRLVLLSQRYDELVAALEEEGDESAENELDSVSGQIDVLRLKKEDWPDTEKVRAGAIVSLGPDGAVRIVRGLIEHEAPGPDGEKRKKRVHPTGYPESVLMDLSAHRTAALRELVAAKPRIALSALLHTLVRRFFYEVRAEGCLGVVATEVALDRVSPSVGESRASQSAAARHDKWRLRLPGLDGLWTWLQKLRDSERAALTAHCIALTVNALAGPSDRDLGSEDADVLAATLGLDMAAWWKPTRANFLDRLTKAHILETVASGVSPGAAQQLSSLKKGDMAAKAEAMLSQGVWLPAPLQVPVSAGLKDA